MCTFWKYGFGSFWGTLAGVLLAGCITPPAGIEMVKGEEQDDIPVPRNFEFQTSEKPVNVPTSEEAKFRHWTGYYRGPGKYNSLMPWYITEMQKLGWKFKEMDGAPERKKLRFEKGDEESTIEVYRELDSGFGGFTNVVCAKIRQRGTEDYTVDENLVITKDPHLRPASFSSKAGFPSNARGTAKLDEAATRTEVAPERNPGEGVRKKKDARGESSVPKEIEDFENSQ